MLIVYYVGVAVVAADTQESQPVVPIMQLVNVTLVVSDTQLEK